MKTVSIVIPVYNEAQDIRKCLEAIQKQTIQPEEVIVVDNNSTDNTVAIAKEFPFVTVVSEPFQGIAHARNKGFNTAKSDIIARIDADTRLNRDWIEKLNRYYKVSSHADRAVSGAGYFYNIYWASLFGKYLYNIAFRYNRFILDGYILWGANMAIPRTMWLDVKANVCDRNDIHEDIDLAIHLHRKGYWVDFRKSLVVGVRMRRVHTDRNKLWPNLMMWPRTVRVHGYSKWPFALLGAVTIYVLAGPLRILERIAIGRSRHPRTKLD